MAKMKEIQLNDNDTGLKVFVSGEPDLSLIPESLMDCFIDAIIESIRKKYQKKNKRAVFWLSCYI